MIAESVVQTSHCFRVKFNLKITFLGKGKVRIVSGFKKDADTDNMGSIILIDFGKKRQIEIQTVPFRRNMPNEFRVDVVAFRYGYLASSRKIENVIESL